MQCKDIPDEPILRLLAERPGTWHTCWDASGSGAMPTVLPAMPKECLPKLALAKMAMLIRRGLVHGCTCGCRGDFYVTPKGLEWLGRCHAAIVAREGE